MMKRIAEGAARIFLACGNTDFRKQIPGLVATVALGLKLDPYDGDYVFIFCNRKRDSIKVLRYDQNGCKCLMYISMHLNQLHGHFDPPCRLK